MSFLESFPSELIRNIFEHLASPDDILSLALTSRTMLSRFRGQGKLFFGHMSSRLLAPDHVADAITIIRIRQLKRDKSHSWKSIEEGILALSQSSTSLAQAGLDDADILQLLILLSQITRLTSDYANRAWKKAQMFVWVHGPEFLPDERVMFRSDSQGLVLSTAEEAKFVAAFLNLELYCQTFFCRGKPLFTDRRQRPMLDSLLCSKVMWLDEAPELLRDAGNDRLVPSQHRLMSALLAGRLAPDTAQFLSVRSYLVHQHRELLSMFCQNETEDSSFRLTGPMLRQNWMQSRMRKSAQFGDALSATSQCWDRMQLEPEDMSYLLKACAYGIGPACSLLDCRAEGKRNFYQEIRHKSAVSPALCSSPAWHIFIKATHRSKQRGFAPTFWDAHRLEEIGLMAMHLENHALVLADTGSQYAYETALQDDDPYYSYV
ncbi:hypothetical protein BKA67DRAFT_652422 [Truncatella angustata]|uniref:F-box domain-containing protein n=1 Tax=Truncatella angustata TaxID=152316 RepID=A0A9P8UVJ9_9PEZI|nr:uncharacterized protein BKA67DRAFT_652422 [Truncatella angustata]KAH6659173.1 hypothetical protein BKA67DRAFT_652422 [Truncatella angustata]KAH8204873.1 hypothetical protein TruAng_000912 [Truncatella angustata]